MSNKETQPQKSKPYLQLGKSNIGERMINLKELGEKKETFGRIRELNRFLLATILPHLPNDQPNDSTSQH